jgi:hypothetical protein
MVGEVDRSGSARGFVAAYRTIGLLKLRLGALPDADAAARVARGGERESRRKVALPQHRPGVLE